MGMIKERQIPKRIRKMRLERNMTQKDLADAIGVTKGYISRIENSDTAPPVGKLLALAQAMQVEIDAFFGAEDPEVHITVTRRDLRPVVSSERSIMSGDGKSLTKYEHLALNYPNRAFEAYVVRAPKQSGISQLMQHKGQELLYVLKGKNFIFNVDGKDYNLEEGDALYFDSSYPHFGNNVSEEEIELLIVIYSGSTADE